MIDPKELQLMNIFMPYATKELVDAVQLDQRFVHYTSAPVALSIIKKREIWMRKVSCMNDYMEIRHGIDLLIENWNNDHGRKLQTFLDENYPGIVKEITDLFDGWQRDMQFSTYITCVSKHHEDEDQIGRLSMWRAYGGNSGVALVIKGSPFFRTESVINVFSTPVAYVDKNGFATEFSRTVEGILKNANVVIDLGREAIRAYVFNFLHFAALGSKHPGFREEEEWRVIYAPKMYTSDFVEKGIEVIRDEPQTVYKLPLTNNDKLGIDSIDLDDILDRVIIGPSENGHAVYEAFVDLLDDEGISNPGGRVFYSDIPLR